MSTVLPINCLLLLFFIVLPDLYVAKKGTNRRSYHHCRGHYHWMLPFVVFSSLRCTAILRLKNAPGFDFTLYDHWLAVLIDPRSHLSCCPLNSVKETYYLLSVGKLLWLCVMWCFQCFLMADLGLLFAFLSILDGCCWLLLKQCTCLGLSGIITSTGRGGTAGCSCVWDHRFNSWAGLSCSGPQFLTRFITHQLLDWPDNSGT